MKPSVRNHSRRIRRRAAVLVAALVTMLLASSLLVTMIKRALDDRRQVRQERELRQVELIVDAALLRAEARLADDAEFTGETWNIPSVDLLGRSAARVVIAAAAVEDDAADAEEPFAARLIRIQVEYPVGSPTSIRRTRAVVLALPSSSDQE